jgi:hypothetical protein
LEAVSDEAGTAFDPRTLADALDQLTQWSGFFNRCQRRRITFVDLLAYLGTPMHVGNALAVVEGVGNRPRAKVVIKG